MEDLDAELIGGFLAWLESSRGCSVQTRNARLAAIRALFRYASFEYPEHAELIQRVLAIPAKRTDTAVVAYLTETETNALINAPATTTWRGHRDKVLFLVAVVTGLRISELVNLTVADVELGISSHLLVHGKGRKERITPLSVQARRHLAAWFKEQNPSPSDPVFPGIKGNRLTRDGVAKILARHLAKASTACPSLAVKNISPHTLRHTCAMRLLQSGMEIATIALWLGHENIRTSGIYLHADLALK